jgi:hypothetical protein
VGQAPNRAHAGRATAAFLGPSRYRVRVGSCRAAQARGLPGERFTELALAGAFEDPRDMRQEVSAARSRSACASTDSPCVSIDDELPLSYRTVTTGSIGGSRPGPKDHGGVSPKVGKFSEQGNTSK